MAELIIADWKLAVLRVTLDLSKPTPRVTSRLHGFEGKKEVEHWSRDDALADFGLSGSDGSPERLRLPEGLTTALEDSMCEEFPHETLLWLRLEPPYGYLGAAPWEEMRERIGVPILRVPDRLPVATRLGNTWRVALIASAPTDPGWAAAHVRGFSAELRAGISRVEIEVFPDALVHRELLNGGPLGAGISVHDPNHTGSTVVIESEAPGSGSEPYAIPFIDDAHTLWSDWITGQLGQHAVSAVHLAVMGNVGAGRPHVLVAADPRSTDQSTATAEAGDIRVLADSLGASLVSIASPETETPDIGARMVSDRLGQLRPGPTIFGSIRLDPSGGGIADIHRFFAEPYMHPLPDSTSWFGYIQPDALAGLVDVQLPSYDPVVIVGASPTMNLFQTPLVLPVTLPRLSTGADLWVQHFTNTDEVPRWAASSLRFLESRQADLLVSSAGPETPGSIKSAYDQGAADALVDIQQLIQQHLEDI